MREIFKSGSVGRAPGNRCLYLEADLENRYDLSRQLIFIETWS
jgi:hypothetical protein